MSTSQSNLLALPQELFRAVVSYLPTEGTRQLSLTCRFVHTQCLCALFNQLQVDGPGLFTPRLHDIHNAAQETKDAIKKLTIRSGYLSVHETDDEDPPFLFRFLSTLPNLQTFSYHQRMRFLRPSSFLSNLCSSLESSHAPLLELSLYTGAHQALESSSATSGPPNLEKLSVTWHFDDAPSYPESSLTQLYSLIQPSLATLVSLTINFTPDVAEGSFDIRFLKPTAKTLRSFTYVFRGLDEGILETIPAVLPNLTSLSIVWSHPENSLIWKESHIESFAKLVNLQELYISSDLEMTEDDFPRSTYDRRWRWRSLVRRSKATESIAQQCLRLERCMWLQDGYRSPAHEHFFVVSSEKQGANGGPERRVVESGVTWIWQGGFGFGWDSEQQKRERTVVFTLEDRPPSPEIEEAEEEEEEEADGGDN